MDTGRPDTSPGKPGRSVAQALEAVLAGRRAPLTAPPPLVSQRLRRIPATVRDHAPHPQRCEVETVLDSRTADPLSGVRGAAAELTRYQILVRTTSADAPEVEVVLDVAPEGSDRVHVRGQVITTPPMPPVFEVAAYGPYGSMRNLLGDELGNFELSSVPRTTARLELTNDVLTIELPAGAWLDDR